MQALSDILGARHRQIHGFIRAKLGHQALVHRNEAGLFPGRCNPWQGFRFAILEPQPGKKLDAVGMRIAQAEFQ